MKKIQDIVKTLTEKEKEMHRELIEECLEREASCLELEKSLQDNIEKLSAITVKMLMDIDEFYKISLELKESCQNAKDDMLKDSIALIPDEKFYRA
ncbi:MAG: hypothetical protein JW864_12285 [Spirochaetes bacterium]|nr:hypothetical protein [Spirochaetota bacterium]